MEVILFNDNDFINGINEIKYEKTTMVMFSKPDCKYCIKCYNDYENSLDESYILAKVNCAEYNNIGQFLKNNNKLNKPVTYPTFIIYKNNLFYKQYTGIRTTQGFKSVLNNTLEKSNLSNKIECVFPIKNYELWNLYQKAKSCFWVEQEIDMSTIKYDWDNKLNDDERYFLSNILAFFSQSDQIVNHNLEERFVKDCDTLPDDIKIYVKLFYRLQMAMEDIHTIVYETILDTCITDKKRNNIFKNAIENVPAIKKKSKWAEKWIDSTSASYGTRLIAFAILEGVFFSGSFCAIYWIKERNILSGITKSNEFIARDESMHYMEAITIFKILKDRNDYNINCTNDMIIEILKEAVDIEIEFITSSFNCRLLGMNEKSMSTYIQYIGDFLLKQLDIKPIYNVNNPFIFMENIGLLAKNNFFESRTTDYAKSNSASSSTLSMLSLDEEF